MIEATVLRKLGWSEALIEAMARVAEPLRQAPICVSVFPTGMAQSLSCTAMYSDVLVNNTAMEVRLTTPDE